MLGEEELGDAWRGEAGLEHKHSLVLQPHSGFPAQQGGKADGQQMERQTQQEKMF